MDILQICEAWGISRSKLCLLLGVTRQHLQHYVGAGADPLPAYLSAHIETLAALPEDVRLQVMDVRLAQYASAPGA